MPAELLVGDPAPDFQTVAVGADGPPEGQPVRLADLREGRVALVFYPSNDPLGARAQFGALRDAWADLRDRARVFAVYHDTPAGNRRLAEQLALPFALLGDDGHHVARAYGCWQGDEGAGIDRGGDSVSRAVILVGGDGRVEGMWRETDPGTLVGWLVESLRA